MKSYFDTLKPIVVKKFEQLLAPHFFYHSLQHTLGVAATAQTICQRENIAEHEADLVKTAALFHDTGFFYTTFNHEEKSCEIALEHMPDAGVSENEMEAICRIIMATKMPHNPTDILQEIICDADLDYLGSEDYEPISNLLFKEMNARGEIYSDMYWLQMQLAFLESHRYFTQSSKQLRNAGKEIQIVRLKKQIQGNLKN
ncbi:MAG TPA: HD domain-containing protein [Bacteroidia bacterium]|nr:HD domain-containing protein [Bacteroidia bacterium]HNU32236.1 HD domain-containing protein [Bacteroidia bacterium]